MAGSRIRRRRSTKASRQFQRKYVPDILLQVHACAGLFSGARTKARESVDWSAAQRIVDGRRVLLGPARLDASRLGVPGRRAGRAKTRAH